MADEALRDQRRVIRFDLPAFGLTGPRPIIATPPSAACSLSAMYDHFGLQHRCWWATFGAPLRESALAMPGRVDKLILGGRSRLSDVAQVGPDRVQDCSGGSFAP